MPRPPLVFFGVRQTLGAGAKLWQHLESLHYSCKQSTAGGKNMAFYKDLHDYSKAQADWIARQLLALREDLHNDCLLYTSPSPRDS